MTSLRMLQKEFSLALLDRTRGTPAAVGGRSAERRFNVYRDNVFVSLTEALATRFPVCRALIGDDVFDAMSRLFVELCPPRSPVLMTYGDDLGDFIELFPPARSVPHLGDMARLEAARSRAYHAADADPLTVEALASLAPCAWDRTRVALHPSVQVIRSRHPIVSIWEAHGRPGGPAAGEPPAAEDALIARPGLEVEIRRLPPGGAVFLSNLLRGATFREAAAKAAASDSGADLVTNLASVLASRIIVGIASTGGHAVVRDYSGSRVS